jgi:hypothetical protein
MIQNNKKLSHPEEIVIKNRKRYYSIVWTILIASLVVSISGLAYIFNHRANKIYVYLVTAIIVFYPVKILTDLFFNKIDKYLDKIAEKIKRATLGVNGENIVYEKIKIILGDKYTIIKNFDIPGKECDADFIIIGDRGLILLEAKNYSSKYIFNPKETYYLNRLTNRKSRSFWEPRYEAKKHAEELGNLLSKNGYEGLTIKKSLVCVSECEIESKYKDKFLYGVYIIQGVDNLKLYFDNTKIDERFTSEFCLKLKNLLTV